MSKILTKISKIFYKIQNSIILRRHNIQPGENMTVNGVLFIQGSAIEFGKNVTISSGKRANVIGGDYRTILSARNEGKIIIGNNVGISNASLISYDGIIIEDDVLVGGGVKMYDSDFHSLSYMDRMEKPDTHIKTAPITVKKGVFIGAHSIILKGVTIGEQSVIGAGSVVAKSIPSGEIWAGNPARFIKKVD